MCEVARRERVQCAKWGGGERVQCVKWGGGGERV